MLLGTNISYNNNSPGLAFMAIWGTEPFKKKKLYEREREREKEYLLEELNAQQETTEVSSPAASVTT